MPLGRCGSNTLRVEILMAFAVNDGQVIFSQNQNTARIYKHTKGAKYVTPMYVQIILITGYVDGIKFNLVIYK